MRNKLNCKVCLLFIVVVCSSFLIKKDKDELIIKKKEIEKEIEFTNKILEETRLKQQYSIQELKLIKTNIRKRNQLIYKLTDEIQTIDKEIDKCSQKLQSYKNDLEKAKVEYADLIYYAFKNRNTNLNFMYLLAAKDINQFYNRYIYLMQYKEYRLKNIELIKRLKILIELNINKLIGNKNDQRKLLNDIKYEKATMLHDEDDVKQIISSLKQQETDLLKQIDEKKRMADKLDKEIEDLIKKEVKKNHLENLTPEDKLISSDFIKNKGRLPWPTEKGVITDHFGEHEHPVMKNITVRNNGIDITTVSSAKARAVFNGDVSKVFTIKGANTTVIIRHGNYYTVYHNLRNVTVRAGDKIALKQSIGEVYSDIKTGETVLHFELWKEMEKQNPEEWLSN